MDLNGGTWRFPQKLETPLTANKKYHESSVILNGYITMVSAPQQTRFPSWDRWLSTVSFNTHAEDREEINPLCAYFTPGITIMQTGRENFTRHTWRSTLVAKWIEIYAHIKASVFRLAVENQLCLACRNNWSRLLWETFSVVAENRWNVN